MKKSRLVAAAASVLLLAGLAACAPPEKETEGEETQSGVKAGEATSAEDFGGMDALVEAAEKEGENFGRRCESFFPICNWPRGRERSRDRAEGRNQCLRHGYGVER